MQEGQGKVANSLLSARGVQGLSLLPASATLAAGEADNRSSGGRDEWKTKSDRR
jgi:hypothetical protein